METNRAFTRAEIKQRAKQSLKGRWGLPIGSYLLTYAMTFFLLFVLGFVSLFISAPLFIYIQTTQEMAGLLFLILIPAILITVLALTPVTYGAYSIYIKISRNEPSNIGDLFKPYKYIWKTIGLSLLIALKTFLWSLLFLIPGIIAALRYSQAMYILIDNPEKSVSQCINESCEMMHGKKADLFVLSLSFLGWALLISIPASIIVSVTDVRLLGNLINIIGNLFLSTYMGVTYVNFYNQLANKVPAEDFGTSEEGFTNQEPATEAEVAQNEFVAPEPVVIHEPEVTSTPDVVTEPEVPSEQEYEFEIEEDK